ncbi:MAG: hypothetical protein RLZZ196_2991 [Bacteroidota bacterium]|jgi:hypothetical protein
MPKITESIAEQSINPTLDSVMATHQKVVVTTDPVLTVAVGRKVNIGNFENVDIMACLTVPMNGVDPSNSEDFSNAIKEAAAEAFSHVSRETGERYQLIKDSQQSR